jgi:tRNA (guanine6-N2)-methyltransferase
VASPPDRPRPRPRRAAPARPGAAPRVGPRPAPTGLELELTCLPGLTDVVVRELHARLGGGSSLRRDPARVVGRPGREDAVALRLPRPSLRAVHELRTLVAVQIVLRYPVPRPKALLGDALRRQMIGDVAAAVADATSVTGAGFTALRLEAAGRDSEVMRRLAEALAEGVGLSVDESDGDLVVRARPEADGWALLLRTTPRPLSTRAWRVCDRPGGLNASLAAAMAWLASPPAGARVANPFVGTGTLAIELALADRRAQVAGFDLDPEAVACARRNAAAAGVADRVSLELGDALAWPQADASLDLVLADPPWGDAVGSRAGNRALYPAFLAEAARCLRPGGRLAWVTHEIELTRAALAGPGPWRMLHDRRVWHGGHHPWVLVLERRAGRG